MREKYCWLVGGRWLVLIWCEKILLLETSRTKCIYFAQISTCICMLHCVLSTFFANLFLFPFWFSFFYKMVRLIWEKKNGIDFISIYFFYKFFCLHLGLNFELQTKTSGEARGFKICYAKLGKKMGIHCSIEKLEKWSIISLMMYVYVSPTCTCALLCNVHNFCLFFCFFCFFLQKTVLLSTCTCGRRKIIFTLILLFVSWAFVFSP